MDRSKARIVVVVAAVVGLSACAATRIAHSDGSLVSASGLPNGTGERIRVTVEQGCPPTMPLAVTDVDNPPHHVLAEPDADAGLVCRYATDNALHFSPGASTDVAAPAPPPVPNLRGSATLSAVQAASLAAVIAATRIGLPSGAASCPDDEAGHNTLIVLGYPGKPDLDLWYHDTGCQTVDNGPVVASERGSDSFTRFEEAVGALVPRPHEGPATPTPSR